MSCRLAAAVIATFGLSFVLAATASAQVEQPYQNREEREIFGNGNDGGSVLDATNPMDLINRIRQSGAMDDATPPSDAIDAALKSFQQEPAGSSKP